MRRTTLATTPSRQPSQRTVQFSIVFDRWRQCTPSFSTPHSVSAPYRCCPLLSRFEYIDMSGHIMCRPLFYPQNSLFPREDHWTPSNTWFLWPTGVKILNGILIGSAVFAGLTIVTARQTERQTTLLVTIGRIYACTDMRRNNC